MSRIYITEYDGDAEEYDKDDPESVGAVDTTATFRDGEEFDAAAYIMECLVTGAHFDVRREID